MSRSLRLLTALLAGVPGCGGAVGETGPSDGAPDAASEVMVPAGDAASSPDGSKRRVPVGLSTQDSKTCVLFSDGTAACWGELAADAPDAPSPVGVDGGTDDQQVAVGYFATCFVSTDGAARCYGDDEYGTVGDGQSGMGIVVATPATIIASGVQSVSMGYAFGCALETSKSVACWGWSNVGQVGPAVSIGDVAASPSPVSELPAIGGVATGTGHACALSADHSSVSCWGGDESGQLGDGVSSMGHDRSTPAPVAGLPTGISAVLAGGSNSCVVTESGELWCWGSNASAQLGTGAVGDPATVPTRINGLSAVTQAAFGDEFAACAVVEGGATYCWGQDIVASNEPDAAWSYVAPTLVTGIPAAAQVAVGTEHACILGVDGTVWCWGSNDSGQCGPLANGDVAATPVQVPF